MTTKKKSSGKKPAPRKRVPKIKFHGKLINPLHFFDRELTWLEFNRRVLQIAVDRRTPLFERIRFCEIFISNLDEYCMKRLGALKNIMENRLDYKAMDGSPVQDKFKQVKIKINELNLQLKTIFNGDIIPGLKKEGLHLVTWSELTPSEKKYIKSYFKENIYPVLTPLSVDRGHPFPFISNLSKSLAVSLRADHKKPKVFARVKIPKNIPQWILTNPNNRRKVKRFVSIEEIISNNIKELFKGMKVQASMLFRITRDAEIEPHDDETDDVMEIIEEGLKERKFADTIRIETRIDPNPWLFDFIKEELEIRDEEHYELKSLPNYSNFKEITSLDIKKLKFKKYRPRYPKELKTFDEDNTSIFSTLRKHDVLVHHPYESFDDSVLKFISSAAKDPKVMAIKMTLYRTDSAGRIIDSLLTAAENGKQVVVVIELKARFDEESNIKWAQTLEDVGIHVTYGFLKTKTHSKLSLIIRRDTDRIRSYAHLGTGNYNPQTSKFYEDFSYLTCKKEITDEVIEVFNHLTGQSRAHTFKELLVAPFNMKSKFLHLINNEIKNIKKGKPARIIAKMNQLEDADIIEKLYAASNAGVKITLIIRGFSCLKPGVKGLSENIKLISIIGKYLEHSRVFYFASGKEKPEDGLYYIGSADWMYRNLENRVEVITPIKDKRHKKRIAHIFDLLISEKRQAWVCSSSGNYTQTKSDDDGVHQKLEHFYK